MRIIILFCISCAVFATLGETEKINEDQSIAVEPAYNLDRVQRDSESRQLKQEKEKEKRPEKNQDPVKKKKELKKKKKQKKEKQEKKSKKGRKNKSGKSKKKGVNRGNNLNKKPNSGKNPKNDIEEKSDKKRSQKKAKKEGAKKHQKKKGKKLKKNLGKNAGISKQDTCTGYLYATLTKKFVVYISQSQKLNRITSWVRLAQNKKAKALSTFSPARNALGTATNQGTSCAGNSSALGAANTTYTTLVSCNTTASTLCDVSLNATSDTLVTSCTKSLATYIADFRACLKTGACSCFQGLVIAGKECEDFSALEAKIKAEKNDCINPDKKGSFGNCRQEERLAAPFTVACCSSYGVVTTQAPGRRHMRLNLNKFFHN